MDKSFIGLVQDERSRQILKEGFGATHDDDHEDGELAIAAACYAMPAEKRQVDASFVGVPQIWPWQVKWWKPTPEMRQRELIKAAALLCAEWDRLERLRIIKESISESEEP